MRIAAASHSTTVGAQKTRTRVSCILLVAAAVLDDRQPYHVTMTRCLKLIIRSNVLVQVAPFTQRQIRAIFTGGQRHLQVQAVCLSGIHMYWYMLAAASTCCCCCARTGTSSDLSTDAPQGARQEKTTLKTLTSCLHGRFDSNKLGIELLPGRLVVISIYSSVRGRTESLYVTTTNT